MFARKFRHHGPEHMSTYLKVFKIGEFVDVKVRSFQILSCSRNDVLIVQLLYRVTERFKKVCPLNSTTVRRDESTM